MTDSPVAAANARTMWKREIPPTPAISSRVNSSARWLSIYQSAFWAGFMDHGLHSKRPHHDRFAHASFDSPCSRSLLRNRNRTHIFFRCTENSSEAVAGNITPSRQDHRRHVSGRRFRKRPFDRAPRRGRRSGATRTAPDDALQGREPGPIRAADGGLKEQLSGLGLVDQSSFSSWPGLLSRPSTSFLLHDELCCKAPGRPR